MDLIVLENNGVYTVDSREVAKMIGREHYNLLKDIRKYIDVLTEVKINVSEYFVESTYLDLTGRELPCYLCTKKGCDMIANKLTGKKGILFTATYIEAFEKMRKFIEEGRKLNNQIPFSELVKSIEIVADSLKVNDASKNLMYRKNFMNLMGSLLIFYRITNLMGTERLTVPQIYLKRIILKSAPQNLTVK